MNRNHLLIVGHLGMGDHIITNAIVRDSALSFDLVVVCAKYNNLESVAHMFSDLPNVAARPVIDHEEQIFFAKNVWKGDVKYLGFDGPNPNGFNAAEFDQEFYRQCGLRFNLRWELFHFPRKEAIEVDVNGDPLPFIFVHQDPARGMMIRDIAKLGSPKWFIKQPSASVCRNIFGWIPALNCAKEIHCIPSSFSILADSLPRVPGQKLVLHKYARPGGELPTYRHDWTILE